MNMFKKMTIQLSHVCVEGYEVGSDRPHFMVPLKGAATTVDARDVASRMHEDIDGEWVYSSSLSPELLASKEFKAAAHEAVKAFRGRVAQRGPGQDVPNVTGTACYVIRWEDDQ